MNHSSRAMNALIDPGTAICNAIANNTKTEKVTTVIVFWVNIYKRFER